MSAATRFLPGFLLLQLCSGCAAISYRADGSTVRHHFGYVQVVTPPVASSSGNVTVLEITTAGVRVQRGVGLGYFKERIESIPLDSRLIVRVQNKQQLDEVMKILGPITKEGLCVVVDSSH